LQALEGAWYWAAVGHVGEIYSALSALLWASAVIFFRKSGEQVPPVALNVFKGAVALVLFLVTMLVLRTPFSPPESSRADWLTLLASGAIGIGIADSLFFASLNRLGASGAAIVDCAYSPCVVICARVYLGEPLRLTLLVAMALMVSAILVGTWERGAAATSEPGPVPPSPVIGTWQPPLHPPTADAGQRRIGVAFGLLSMFLMAVGIVLAKPVLNRSNVWWSTPLRVVGGQLLLSVQALLPAHRASVARAFRPGRRWLHMLPSAVLGSYLAMVAWIAGMKHTRAGIAGILNQTSTLFMPLLAAVFLREKLTRRKLLAVGLGFVGALVVTL
jgi:drug/metabolite transporter (DMT)-like permease